MGADRLNALLEVVFDRGASDLHITAGIAPVMRVYGSLVRLEGDPLTCDDTEAIVTSCMTPEQCAAFETRRELDFAYRLDTRARFRVNAYFQRGSVGAAFRHIPKRIPGFDELGLPQIVEDLAMLPRGLVLVTGPTGAGKSTTLAAMVNHINTHRDVHVMTLEDPIEYLHDHRLSIVNQREVGRDTRSFSEGLRHVLRQDPDVILVGEMRDLETMRAALTAAETGHLVLSTLHTQGAVQTIDRVIDVFPPHQQNQIRVQLSMVLKGLVSQELLAKYDGEGLVVACEVLIPTPAICNIIREGKTHQLATAMQTGGSDGMITMDRALAGLLRNGSVSAEAALKKAQDPDSLKTLMY